MAPPGFDDYLDEMRDPPMYFDRQGKPITLRRYEELLRRGELARRVALTNIGEDIQVSTVWLGLNHNWAPQGPPLIFETMVFGGPLDEEQVRYPTESQAQMGHRAMVNLVMLELQLELPGPAEESRPEGSPRADQPELPEA